MYLYVCMVCSAYIDYFLFDKFSEHQNTYQIHNRLQYDVHFMPWKCTILLHMLISG
jgi:hypothetical protein